MSLYTLILSWLKRIHGFLISDKNNCTIEGLIVGGFSSDNCVGILINSNSDYNTIKGCYIGVTSSGEGRIANYKGVRIDNGAGNIIGGTIGSNRNIISGNSNDGIFINASNSNEVLGNYIGNPDFIFA